MDRSNRIDTLPIPTPSQLVSSFTPLIFLYILAALALLIMLPTALATWYSKCYNISLFYGFLVVLSPVILGLVSLIFPKDMRSQIKTLYSILMSCVIIYGVFLQFIGKCKL